ncbi:unnamed protein product [Medioppia subpectinata]|uniref:Transmembrane protein 208 n=1 Tax=Medioppia subpectinata TaxID=1979941 RepID=A0A7R9L4F1_9ACAR|nr:unnamed protein product [Medioppia subpectinata]CAG2115130.1 unnamed protein product [Medioppia subpectinata]
MAVPKGKALTKGQKQIVEENKSCLRFYTIMSSAAMVIIVFSGAVYLGSIGVMQYMAKAVYSPTGGLIDGGIDLNMKNGFAEHLKDLIILTTGVQSLSLISNYFWILWLLAPGYAMYMLWVNILGPWFFQQPDPQQTEAEDKKQKKMDRRMRRMQ